MSNPSSTSSTACKNTTRSTTSTPDGYPFSPPRRGVQHHATPCSSLKNNTVNLGQMPVPKRFPPLSQKQLTAVELLIHGRSDEKVAAILNVNRTTVFRWRAQNPLFQAELSRRREQIYGASADRLRHAITAAMDSIKKELTSENAVISSRAARTILQVASRPAFVPSGEGISVTNIVEKVARQKRMERLSKDLAFGPLEDEDYLLAMQEFARQEAAFNSAHATDGSPSDSSTGR
jgi:hypothetical protein